MRLKLVRRAQLDRFIARSEEASGYSDGISHYALNNIEAYFIQDNADNTIGYIVRTSAALALPEYENTLLKFWVEKSVYENNHLLLANIIRSLHLSGVLVRSDDIDILKKLLHYTIDYYHIYQVYKHPATGGAKLESKQKFKKGAPESILKLMKSLNLDKMLPADIIDSDSIETTYTLYSGRKILASVFIYPFSGANEKLMIPVVPPKLRRMGYATLAMSLAAKKIIGKDEKPVVVIKPSDETARRFVESNLYVPQFDLLRVIPKFHLVPMPDDMY